MIPFGRMFVAGLGALFVSCCTAGTAALLVFASALSGTGDGCRDGGCGDNGVQLVIALTLVAVAGIALSAGTVRVLLGRRGRGMAKLLVISGGVLLVGTMLLLAGSIFIGHAITGGAGALWFPLGLLAAVVFLVFWTRGMTRLVNVRGRPA